MGNELSTTSILNLFDTTKKERSSFVDNVIEDIDHGNTDILKVHVRLKQMESIIDMLNKSKKYKTYLLQEAEKNGKNFQLNNAEFQIKEGVTKYDWSICQDGILYNLLIQQEEVNKAISERQAFLKTVPEAGLTLTDDETGETWTVYRPAKTSSTTVSVTLL